MAADQQTGTSMPKATRVSRSGLPKFVKINEKTFGGKREQHGALTRRSPYPKSIKYIISSEFCERFAFYGIRTVLVLYITGAMAKSNSVAIMIAHSFVAIAYFMPLLGAVVSDGFVGKYHTIIYLSLVYAVGTGILASTAGAYTTTDAKFAGLLVGLFLIAVGTGGIKPCVAAFGGDQFLSNSEDPHGVEQRAALQSYFTMFYFAINAGSVLTMVITPNLRQYGCPDPSSSQCSYLLAFGLPSMLMFMSVLLIILGRSCVGYVEIQPSSNPVLSRFLRVVFLYPPALSKPSAASAVEEGSRNDTEPLLSEHSRNYAGAPEPDPDLESTVNQRQHENKIVAESDVRRNKWYTKAVALHGQQVADEVRQVGRMVWVMLPMPLFWCLFDQVFSTWVVQATSMSGKLSNGLTILPDMMGILNAIAILILLPVFERFIYPMAARMRGGSIVPPLQRMAVGMLFAGAAFVLAGFLQLRVDSCPSSNPRCVHILWQVPQYFVLSIGEILFAVTGLEFAYAEAPASMKAVMQSLWLLTVCFGNILVVACELIVNRIGLSPANAFFTFAGVVGFAFIWFAAFTKGYTYASVSVDREDEAIVVASEVGEGGRHRHSTSAIDERVETVKARRNNNTSTTALGKPELKQE